MTEWKYHLIGCFATIILFVIALTVSPWLVLVFQKSGLADFMREYYFDYFKWVIGE